MVETPKYRTHAETIEAAMPLRELSKDASASAVRQVLGRYISDKDKIIEVGSGLGWFVQLVSEYRDRIQQTDADPELVEKHKTLYPQSNIKVVNVGDPLLPFGKHSFDMAVGLNTLDELLDLEYALLSIGRTLSTNGKLIHFRDLVISPQSLALFDYDRDEYVPFPAFDKEGYSEGIRLIRRNVASNLRRLDPNAKSIVAKYLEDPEGWYERLAASKQALRDLSDIGVRLSSQAPVIRFEEYHLTNFELTLRKTGYNIVDSGKIDGIAVVDKSPALKIRDPKDNLYHNDVGRYRRKFDPRIVKELGLNQVKLVSTVQYLVAQKDNSFWAPLEARSTMIADLLESASKGKVSSRDAAKILENLLGKRQ